MRVNLDKYYPVLSTFIGKETTIGNYQAKINYSHKLRIINGKNNFQKRVPNFCDETIVQIAITQVFPNKLQDHNNYKSTPSSPFGYCPLIF